VWLPDDDMFFFERVEAANQIQPTDWMFVVIYSITPQER
jgi:hypothetical protein